MSPEEHFRRLRNDDVWGSIDHPAAPAAEPVRTRARRRDRGPLWATAVVGASLVVITLAAVHGAGAAGHGGAAGAPAAPVIESAAPTRATDPTPTPSDTRSVDPSDPSLRQFEFFPDDPADMVRAKTIIACFKSHGVKIVTLEQSEGDTGTEGIAFGGPKNDHESITKGLQYSTECFKAGGPVQ